MTQYSRILNYKLNELKNSRPNDRALIEAIQSDINRKVEVISPSTRKSLLQFPMQFTQRVRTSSRDWTTQLHQWADYQLKELLMIDPIYLTTSDSDDECVLKRLIKAVLGLTMTQQVNYELLEQIFQKDMKYSALTVVADPDSAEGGNAWFERDLDGKTVVEYLYDFANGEGEFSGKGPDERILAMFDQYAETALELPDENLEADVSDVDPEEDQANVIAAQEERDHGMQTNTADVPLASEDGQTEKMDDVNGEGGIAIAPPKEGEAKENGGEDKMQKVLGVLLKLSECLG